MTAFGAPQLGEGDRSWLQRLGRAPAQHVPRVIRAAFAARVSTDDQQDPTLSLPRQLAACQRGLPDNMVVVLHFYDIESGRGDLALRGHGDAHEKFDLPIPRDGGIDDLLAEAKRADRRFDVVICESVDRIARITYYGTKIEHELEQAGVLLLAADEGISLARRRATNVLTRRMKQGIAEWYVLDMLEKSWGGFEIHTKQGWNIGRAPYGYLADSIPHPVPARRAEGKHKTRLIPDPERADIVRQIFHWRISERLGYRVIAERLNLDLAVYPPPMPTDPRRAVGRWTGSAVREILKNPKYTGHMVWNRRATKKGGKVNPVSAWVFSAEPTHPAIITPEEFAAAHAVSPYRERCKSGSEPNTHPATRHSYALRSYLVCDQCGRRMFGKTRRRLTYYACQPPDGRRPQDHPVSVLVPEAPLLDLLTTFFNTRLLGPDRIDLLAAGLIDADEGAVAEHTRRLAAVQRRLDEVTSRQGRLLRQAEDADARDPFTLGLRGRYNDLDAERRTLEAQVADLQATPPSPNVSSAGQLLDLLPIANLDLADLPTTVLRALCEAFRIRITYDHRSGRVHYGAELAAEALDDLTEVIMRRAQICDVPPAGPAPDGKLTGRSWWWPNGASRCSRGGSGSAALLTASARARAVAALMVTRRVACFFAWL